MWPRPRKAETRQPPLQRRLLRTRQPRRSAKRRRKRAPVRKRRQEIPAVSTLKIEGHRAPSPSLSLYLSIIEMIIHVGPLFIIIIVSHALSLKLSMSHQDWVPRDIKAVAKSRGLRLPQPERLRAQLTPEAIQATVGPLLANIKAGRSEE